MRLADDLIWLLSDRAQARRDAEAIRAALEKRYTVDRMAEQIEHVYQQVVNRISTGHKSQPHGVSAARQAY